jgi:hypothetical protein
MVDGLSGSQARVYTAKSPLWGALGRAIGIPHATLATFAGNRVSAV